ncbi:MAG: type II toxin-antitoxin system HicB family antitoxin [Bacillota bacterium]
MTANALPATGAPPGIARAAGVLTSYIEAAMSEARFERLSDGTYYGEIPPCPGVWANEPTGEGCRETLRDVLETWLLLKLRDRDPLPLLGGIDLNQVVEETWDQ